VNLRLIYPKTRAIRAHFGYLRHPWTIYPKTRAIRAHFGYLRHPWTISAALLTLILLQASTYPIIHGFPSDVVTLLLIEGILLLVSILPASSMNLAALVLASCISYRFWFLLVHIASGLTTLIQFFSCSIGKLLVGGFGFSAEGIRVQGSLVIADPSKTAAFAFLVLLLNYFLLSIAAEGFKKGLTATAKILLPTFLFLLMRWFIFASALGWIQPDLVINAWHLFYGYGLVVSFLLFIIMESLINPRRNITNSNYSCSPDIHSSPCDADTATRHFLKPAIGWVMCLIVICLLPISIKKFHQKPLKILIDEIHSDWEPIFIDSDKKDDFVLAENNYNAWYTYLKNLASISIALSSTSSMISSASISNNIVGENISLKLIKQADPDVIILKCPTKAYSSEEIKVLLDFTNNGGTIWAIGEHTDVFFINSCLNDVLASANIHITADGVCDHAGRWLITGGPLHSSLCFSPSPGRYMWATGASIRGGLSMLPLAVSSPDAFSDKWVPTNRNFFGNLAPDNGHVYGPFTLSAFVPYGKGKIFVHGDSTNFNASMFTTPGKREFTRNIIENALVPNCIPFLRVFSDIIFAVLSATLLSILISRRCFLMSGLIVAATSLVFCGSFLYSICLPNLADDKSMYQRNLALDTSLNPAIGISYGNQEVITALDSFDPVLVQLQNPNLLVYTAFSSISSLIRNGADSILLAEPTIQPDAQTIMELQNWLQLGGTLIIISSEQQSGPARTMALSFGLQETTRPSPSDIFPNLVKHGAFSIVNEDEVPIVFYPIGSGTLLMIESWKSKSKNPLKYRRLAEIIFSAINKDYYRLISPLKSLPRGDCRGD